MTPEQIADALEKIRVGTGEEFVVLDEAAKALRRLSEERDAVRRMLFEVAPYMAAPWERSHGLLADHRAEEIATLRDHLRRLVDHIEVCFFQSQLRDGETCAEYRTRMQGVHCEGCDFCRAKKILGG